MPRSASGPRRIDQSGTWYAVKVINGKRHTISLGTKNKPEAMRKWPAAQAQLEALATPKKYPRDGKTLVTTRDDAGNTVEEWATNESLFRDSELYDEEDTSIITWEKAEEIAARRYVRRTGKDVSRSWRYQILNAKRHISCKYPLDVTTKDVRQMVDKMEDEGFAASTIAQRTSALSNLLEALIKGGYTDDAWVNPFERVDTHGVSTKSFYKAKPEDYQWISSVDFLQARRTTQCNINTLKILIYTGARISEVVNGAYEYQCLVIKEGKNRASVRQVPLPDFLAHIKRQDIATSVDSFRRWFNKHRPKEELTPHSYRHGFKSAARVAKADEVTVERLLGHTIPKMLMVYGEFPVDVLQREAIKVQEVIQAWTSS